MTFDEALKILDIEIYKNRIIHSNSHGELFHLADYILLAKYWNKKRNELPEFPPLTKQKPVHPSQVPRWNLNL